MSLSTANIPKDKLQRIILVGLGALAAVAVAYQFSLGRAWRNYSTARSDITRLTAEIGDAERRQQNLARNADANRQLREFVQAQQVAMVQGDAFSWMVREISLLADQHPIRVLSLRPGADHPQAREGKGPVAYTSRLEIAGGYDEIGRFIRDLENRFPTAEIRALELAGNTAGAGGHQANLDLSILMLPPEAQAGKPEKSES